MFTDITFYDVHKINTLINNNSHLETNLLVIHISEYRNNSNSR